MAMLCCFPKGETEADVSLDTHKRAPDAAGIEGWLAWVRRTDDGVLLTEVRKVLSTHIHIPALEPAGHLSIEERIYRSTSVLIQKVSVCILEVFHEVIYAT